MSKKPNKIDVQQQIEHELQKSALKYDGICVCAVLEVLGVLFSAPADERVFTAALGLTFTGKQKDALCVNAATALYIADRARHNGLTKENIATLCQQWQQDANTQTQKQHSKKQEAKSTLALLTRAYYFSNKQQEQLGLCNDLTKPKQYYEGIYADRESMFKHSPYALEEKLAKAVTRGEETAALAFLREINAQGEKAVLAKTPLRSVKNSMIGSIAFLARAAIQAGVSANDAFALSDAQTQQIEEMMSPLAVLAFEETILLQFIALVRQRLAASYSAPVVKAMHYVDSRLDAKISLNDAANYAGVHPSYLSARFKKETGHPFTNYIAVRKIQESSYFVRHTDYSISQIASLYGFSSQSYYITIFKKIMGTTPMVYRQQLLA